MKKLLFSILCALAFLPEAGAQGYLTLEEAIRLGLENNYAIRIAARNQEIAENNYSLGEAGLLPVVDAAAGKNWSRGSGQARFITDSTDRIREFDNVQSSRENAAVEANYLLNIGSIYTFKRLGMLAEIGELEAKVTIENTIAAITTAYYRLVLEQQRYELLQNTLNYSDERLKIAKDKYELGRASKQEYLAAQVDYNTDLTALINQEEVISIARVQLNELLVHDPRQDILVRDTILINAELELEGLIEATNNHNPQLLAAQRQINVVHLRRRELEAQRLPELNLFGSYTRQTSEDPASQRPYSLSTGFNYGLTARLNLFNGFILRNRIQNAKIIFQNEELQFKGLQLALEADMIEVYTSYQNSLRLLGVARSNYEVAEENAVIALERYKLGNTSSLEFREAQQNELLAQSRLINVLYTIKSSEIELQRLAGSLLSGF